MIVYKLDHALGGKASTQRRTTAKHSPEIPPTTKQRANTLSATCRRGGQSANSGNSAGVEATNDNGGKVSARGTSNSGKASAMINNDSKINSYRTNHREHNKSTYIYRHSEELHKKSTEGAMEVSDHTGQAILQRRL
jgi:hypothetical protein